MTWKYVSLDDGSVQAEQLQPPTPMGSVNKGPADPEPQPLAHVATGDSGWTNKCLLGYSFLVTEEKIGVLLKKITVEDFWSRWWRRWTCIAFSHNNKKESQLNLKTNKTQNCQKIELYGSPTTKDLKKPHSSRCVGEVEIWKWVERRGDMVWLREVVAVEWRSHIHVWWTKSGGIPWEWVIPAPGQTTQPRVPELGR